MYRSRKRIPLNRIHTQNVSNIKDNNNNVINKVQIMNYLPSISCPNVNIGDSVIVMPEGIIYTLVSHCDILKWKNMGSIMGEPGNSTQIIEGDTLPPINNYEQNDVIILIPSNKVYTKIGCNWVLIAIIPKYCENQIGIRTFIIQQVNDEIVLPNPSEYREKDTIIFLPSGQLYVLNNQNTWINRGTIKGPDGEPGPTGEDGLPASKILVMNINENQLPPVDNYDIGQILIIFPSSRVYKLGTIFNGQEEEAVWLFEGILRGSRGEDPPIIAVYENENNIPPPLPIKGYENGVILIMTPSGDTYRLVNNTWVPGENIRGPKGDIGPSGNITIVIIDENENLPNVNDYNVDDSIIFMPSGRMYVLKRNPLTNNLEWIDFGVLKGETGEQGEDGGVNQIEGFDANTINNGLCTINYIYPVNNITNPENISVVFQPTNNGSFQLTDERNCRGNNSVDLQIVASNSNTPISEQIVLGNNSFIASGISNQIQDNASVIVTGLSNSIIIKDPNVKDYNFIGTGNQNILSGTGLVNSSGNNNVLDGVGSSNLNGNNTSINASFSENINGNNNRIGRFDPHDVYPSEFLANTGGNENEISGRININVGGTRNRILNTQNLRQYITLGGGKDNIAEGINNFVSGIENQVSGTNNGVCNGELNKIQSNIIYENPSFSNIINGRNNIINSYTYINNYSSIINGEKNLIERNGICIGGLENVHTGEMTISLGGEKLNLDNRLMVATGRSNEPNNSNKPLNTVSNKTTQVYEYEVVGNVNRFRTRNITQNDRGNNLFSVSYDKDLFIVNDRGIAWTRNMFACSNADISEIYICNDIEKPVNGTLMTVDSEGFVHAFKKGTKERILGVISSDPMIIGNYNGMFMNYIRDENTGLIIKDENGNPLVRENNKTGFKVKVGICGRVIMKKEYKDFIPSSWYIIDIKMKNFVMVQIR